MVRIQFSNADVRDEIIDLSPNMSLRLDGAGALHLNELLGDTIITHLSIGTGGWQKAQWDEQIFLPPIAEPPVINSCAVKSDFDLILALRSNVPPDLFSIAEALARIMERSIITATPVCEHDLYVHYHGPENSAVAVCRKCGYRS